MYQLKIYRYNFVHSECFVMLIMNKIAEANICRTHISGWKLFILFNSKAFFPVSLITCLSVFVDQVSSYYIKQCTHTTWGEDYLWRGWCGNTVNPVFKGHLTIPGIDLI